MKPVELSLYERGLLVAALCSRIKRLEDMVAQRVSGVFTDVARKELDELRELERKLRITK